MNCKAHTAVAVTLVLAAGQPGAAYEIYKWTDRNGVVHYSESRPEQMSRSVETLYIEPTTPPGYNPEDDHWSVINQAARIGSEWKAIQQQKEKDLALQRARDAERRLAELEARLADYQEPEYAFFTPIYRPLIRPNHRRPPIIGHAVHNRFPHGHGHTSQPSHRNRDETTPPRPGWSAPDQAANANPTIPGFRSSDSN